MFFFRFFSHSYFIHIVISCTFYLHNRRHRANSIENAPLLLLGLLSCAAGLDQPDWPPKRWRVMFISGTRFYLRLHPNGRTSLRRLVPVRLRNPLAVAPLRYSPSPALSLWYSPSPALAITPLWYSLPLEPLPFALTVFLEFRFRSLPMSRGTRIGDVYCVGSGPEEEEDDHDCLPIKVRCS